MTVRVPACLLAAFVVGGLVVSPSRADDDPGQEDLDQAITAKLSADSFRALGSVADLCQSAIDKGLAAPNLEFAKQMLAGALLERASAVCAPLLGGGMPDEQWPLRRRVAMEDLERAIECDPRQPLAQLIVAQLQALPGGNREQALAALDTAVELTGDDHELQSEALRLRAGLRSDVAASLADLDQAVQLAPTDPKPLRARGELRLAQNKAAEALSDFDAALALDPGDATTHEARGMTEGILRNWDEARASFTRATELAPGSTLPYVERGRINFLAGDVEAALADASEALELNPNDLAALHFRAQVLGSAGKLEEALADINQVLIARPGFVDGLRIWATLIVMTGKVAETTTALERRGVRRPDDVITFVRLGLLYASQRQSEQAIVAYTAALRLERQAAFAYQARGDAYLNIGKQREAIADYDSALEREPGNTGVLNNLAWVLATSPDAALRDGRRAVELATKACELTNYRLAHIVSTLAAGYAELGDFSTAQRWSREAVGMGDEEMKTQLSKELDSYQAGKPWRELQSESEMPTEAPPQKSAQKKSEKPR
ncbi:MAG TPA: tetratricopeptide repeat protein [Pirellulales bacterium]|nr:tetratricopeptide repeat protein [Pirellulales bacterium]